MAALTNLRQLHLAFADYGSDGYAPLAALRSLRGLGLDSVKLPANLWQLTWLESLRVVDQMDVWEDDPEQRAILLSALPHLARLRYVAVPLMPGLESLPAALAGLSQLHTFIWQYRGPQPADAALPVGPWLGSLRRLAAPAFVLANSLHLLEAAPRLQHLVVTVVDEQPTLCILLRAARFPSLLRLSLATSNKLPAVLYPAAFEAQRQRPSLRIDLFFDFVENVWHDVDPVD